MQFALLFLNFLFCLSSNGFLLDDRTQPPQIPGQAMTDKHFYILMDLLTEERNARLKQSIEISDLKKEVLVTQQSVTTNFHASHSGNDTLKTELDILKGNIRQIMTNYSNLQNDYTLVNAELNQLKLNNIKTNQYAKLLEKELSTITHLKSVADLQTILNLTNDTKRLDHELQITNDKMSSIGNDVSARKQDFIALYNKADLTERSLDQAWKTMETNLSSMMLQMEISESRFRMLEKTINVSTGKLENEIQSNIGKVPVVIFRARNVNPDTGISATVIKFPDVVINSGSGYDKLTGKFTAPQAGTYLFILQICPENQRNVQMTLRANNNIIGIFNQKNSHDNGLCTSTTAVTVLSKGEEVWVYCESASSADLVFNDSENGNSFSGVLLHTGTI